MSRSCERNPTFGQYKLLKYFMLFFLHPVRLRSRNGATQSRLRPRRSRGRRADESLSPAANRPEFVPGHHGQIRRTGFRPPARRIRPTHRHPARSGPGPEQRHDSRRVDRQLIGRCARQGDPGLVRELVSREDGVLACLHPRWAGWMRLWPRLTRRAIARAQTLTDARGLRARVQLLRRDEQLTKMMAFAGGLD